MAAVRKKEAAHSALPRKGTKESNDTVPYPYPSKGNAISLLERIRSWFLKWIYYVALAKLTGIYYSFYKR